MASTATSQTSTPTGPTVFSSIPIPPQTSSTTNGGSSNSGGGNGGGGNQFPSSSASNLYLYTFLATLVLLLMVSGAVIVRSVTLRVRARRALEESIRNGTYVPPQPALNAANAVKPKFHDAHIKELDADALMDEKVSRWGSIVPITASFVPAPGSKSSPATLPQPATTPSSPRNGSLFSHARALVAHPFRTVQLQDILDELASRDLHARLARQQASQPSQAELAAAAFAPASGTGTGTEEGSTQQEGTARPAAVRLAVLIAMPDPTHPSNIGDSHSDARSMSSSSMSSTKGKTPALAGGAGAEGEEPEIPYVEFGVAEVPFYTTATKTPSLPNTSSVNDSE